MPFADTPPQYDIRFAGGGKPPMFNFAKSLGDYLKQFMGASLPSYQGQIDPGLSPTMMNLGSMLQQRSMAPTPIGLSMAQGSLGKYMNPNFANATARSQFGAPSYFGFNPNQQTYGGTPMSEFSQLGMSGPMGNQPSGPFLPFGGGQGPQQPSWMDFWNGPPIPGLSFQNPNYPLPGGQPFPIPGFPGQPAGPVAGGPRPMIPDESGQAPPAAPPPPKKRPGQMTRKEWIAAGMKPAERKKTFTDTQRKWLDTLSPEDQKKYGYTPTGGLKNLAPDRPKAPLPPATPPKRPRNDSQT